MAPFVRRGVQFRTSPSSALSISNANTPAREGGTYVGPVNDPNRAGQVTQGLDNNNPATSPTTTPSWDSWMNPGVNNPNDPTGQAGLAAQSYAEQAQAYLAGLRQQQMFGGIQPADQAAIDAEYAIRVKEAQLAQAQIDGDFAEAERLKVEIAANKAAMAAGLAHTREMADPQFEQALELARGIVGRNLPAVQGNTATATGEINQAYGSAGAVTSETAGAISAGDAALQAALQITGRDQDLFLSQNQNRGQHASNLVGLTQNVGVSGVEAIAATFNRQMMDAEAMDKQHWADEDRAIAEIFENLARQQQSLDLQSERDALQKSNAERGLLNQMDVNFEGTNAYEVGVGAATDYITTQMGNAPIHRTAYLHNQLEELFMDPSFQAAGDYSPNAVYAYYGQQILDDQGLPTGQTLADILGITTSELKIIADSVGVYSATSSQWQNPAQPGTDGPKGQEVYTPGGEAPNNAGHVAEAKAGEGPYGARAAFAAQWAPQFAAAFGLRADGINYFRPVGAHEGNPDRSANSDHITAGAVDFFGTEAAMQQALIAAQNDPNVSFAKVHGDPRHLHVSFDIGVFS